MNQTKSGIASAASQIGISVEEYLSKIEAGLKWCCKCKSWQPIDCFHSDKSRFDKKKPICKNCTKAIPRLPYKPKPTLAPKTNPIKIGTRFGLWEVIGEPSLSKKGKITQISKYPCICHGCNCKFDVENRYLLFGKSKGCKKCRTSQNIKELRTLNKIHCNGRILSPKNPLCPSCQTLMKRSGRKTTQKGLQQYYKCGNCKTNTATTVKPRCNKCGGVNTYKNGGNLTINDGFIQRYYCRDCKKTFK
ncbi:MAG TPA: hypothetical protein VK211_23945 [Kamptonema sp.]|nr:hypothetical protein [Kamptonema sp.]